MLVSVCMTVYRNVAVCNASDNQSSDLNNVCTIQCGRNSSRSRSVYPSRHTNCVHRVTGKDERVVILLQCSIIRNG